MQRGIAAADEQTPNQKAEEPRYLSHFLIFIEF
jgi:hypothetical protein